MVAGVQSVPPLTHVQQSAVLLLHRSDPQVRFVTAADDKIARSFSVVNSEPRWWFWGGLRCRRHLQTRRRGIRGSVDSVAVARENRWLMELQQGSTGFLTLARLTKFEDNWFLKRGG